MTPAVTILLPVYNSASTLQQTLDSLWAQTFTDFELLAIDDGSTDDTPDILRANSDPRLRVLRNPQRLKLAGALNRGIAEARAPLIARIDADDLARPQRLAAQVAFMRRHPRIALCGTWTRHFGDRRKKTESYPQTHDALRAFALFNCPFAHPTVLFRTRLFRENHLTYDGNYNPTEDYELWTRLLHRFPCANLPRVLLNYRVHPHSMTGSDWTNMDEQARRIMHNQYAALGVPCTRAQSRLNRDIGMARVAPADLPAARDWLENLHRHNQTHPYCPADALLAQLRERWFHVCMNATRGGPAVYQHFLHSTLWTPSPPPLAHRLLLRASILRRTTCSEA